MKPKSKKHKTGSHRTGSAQLLRPESSLQPLNEMRGIAKELFAELGGGEAFIRRMREDCLRPE
jgi:hypothetical protein